MLLENEQIKEQCSVFEETVDTTKRVVGMLDVQNGYFQKQQNSNSEYQTPEFVEGNGQ